MSRNVVAALGVVLVGGLLWMVTAWPAQRDDDDAGPIAAEPPPPPPPPRAAEPEPPAEPAAPPPAAPPPAAPEPATEPKPQDPPPPQADLPTDLFQEDQGPVAERKRIYETEPRDSAATEAESMVRAAFNHPDGAPDLFKSVLCRQTICKVEIRWNSDRLGAYIAGMTRVSLDFDREFAAAAAGPPNPDQTRPVTVYLKRKPAAAAN